MDFDTKRKLQIGLVLAIAVAAIRTGYILYERHIDETQQVKSQAPPLNPDFYVVPKKLHPYDVKSAKQLTQQPAWVMVGYSITRYPYNPATRRVDFHKDAGQLLPLEKLDIKDVIAAVSPEAPDQKQIMAVFAEGGKSYAFSIGSVKDDNYRIYSDDMLFIQDPHELYKHWPADVWSSIDKHEVKPGMSELQADFAIGFGTLEGSGESRERILDYPNGGKPLKITYYNGKITDIQPGQSS
jgi:hypothetical protein